MGYLHSSQNPKGHVHSTDQVWRSESVGLGSRWKQGSDLGLLRFVESGRWKGRPPRMTATWWGQCAVDSGEVVLQDQLLSPLS